MARPVAAQLHAFADKLRPAVRRQFLQAVRAVQDAISLDELAEAVTRGGLTVKLDTKIAGLSTRLQTAIATVGRIFDEAQQAEERSLQQRYRLTVRFDLVNPQAVTAANRGAQLVRDISAQTRRGVQAVIARSIREGIAPREAARLIRPMVGLTERQAMAVINYRFSLLESGADGEAVARAAARYTARLQTQRATTIARTETIKAGREGRHAVWQQAKAEGLLPEETLMRWVVTDDDRLCPACEPLAGEQVPLGSTFPKGGGDGPPLHPNCRCTSTLVIPRRSRAAA